MWGGGQAVQYVAAVYVLDIASGHQIVDAIPLAQQPHIFMKQLALLRRDGYIQGAGPRHQILRQPVSSSGPGAGATVPHE